MGMIKAALPQCFLRNVFNNCNRKFGSICDKCTDLMAITKYFRCDHCGKIFLFEQDYREHLLAIQNKQ